MAESMEKAGQMKSDLAAEKDVLQVSTKRLAEVQADFSAKNASFIGRVEKRKDELMAVAEAMYMMGSDEMADFKKDFWGGGGWEAPKSATQKAQEAFAKEQERKAHRHQ